MIHLFRVFKDYGKGRRALQDVNLTIEKGEFVWITGPSGAGKTTLFKLLICEEASTSGQIQVLGKTLSQLHRTSIPFLRRHIGCVFQDFRLLYPKTVFDNAALPLRILGLSARQIRLRVLQILRLLGLGQRADSYPADLSRGEQQRVAIARALVTRPSIILADEPTGNLDERLEGEVMGLLKEINLQGATVLVATHRQGHPRDRRQREIALDQGRVVRDQLAVSP